MSGRFDGKVAVVTGAAAGFGLAVSTRLVEEGARVVMVDWAADALAEAAAELSSLPVVADVSQEADVAAYDRVWAVNARGVFMGLRAVLRVMKPQRSGVIVNTASMAAIKGAATFSPYIASKHAVLGLTKSAALEGAPFGIRVNCVAPGHIDTRMGRDLTAQINPEDPESVYRAVSESVPLGKRYGTATEVSNLVVWLLSPESE